MVGEGNSRDTSVHPTQHEAIERAREIALNQRSEVVIHGEDGKIRDKNSYGTTHFPPRLTSMAFDTQLLTRIYRRTSGLLPFVPRETIPQELRATGKARRVAG